MVDVEGPVAAEAPAYSSLEFGGQIEFGYERRQNFDLSSDSADELDLLPLELQLEFLFTPNDYLEVLLQPTLLQEVELRRRGEDDAENIQLLIEEAYVTLSEPDWGVSLLVGRQSFEDERQWLYDAALDAVRGVYRTSDLAVEVTASRKGLVREDLLNSSDEERINNYILHGALRLADDVTVGAYGLVFDQREADRDRPVFLGLYSHGTIGGRLTYWADIALLRGREQGTRLRGYGVDFLAAYRLAAPLSPHVLLGYAFGSGDADPDDSRDGGFRQTGLHGNEVAVMGGPPFSYYGEAFDPELSNMSIFTAGIGARPVEALSVDVVGHYYVQDEPADELRGSAFDAEPSGRSRRLGSELDLVLGFEGIEDVQIKGFLGYFIPGPAFASAKDALFARVEFQYDF